jgi:hypothetical protein
MTPATPLDTFGFMVAGYAVVLVGLALYGLSLVTRLHRLDRQEKRMDELENEESSRKREQAR